MSSSETSGAEDPETTEVNVGLLTFLKSLRDILSGRLETLEEFLDRPGFFIRSRVLAAVLGFAAEIVFSISDGVSAGYAGLAGSIEAVGSSFGQAPQRFTTAVTDGITAFQQAAVDATAGLGILQPFVLTTIYLLTAAGVGFVLVRTGRAILDAIPGLSGVETFLFG